MTDRMRVSQRRCDAVPELTHRMQVEAGRTDCRRRELTDREKVSGTTRFGKKEGE